MANSHCMLTLLPAAHTTRVQRLSCCLLCNNAAQAACPARQLTCGSRWWGPSLGRGTCLAGKPEQRRPAQIILAQAASGARCCSLHVECDATWGRKRPSGHWLAQPAPAAAACAPVALDLGCTADCATTRGGVVHTIKSESMHTPVGHWRDEVHVGPDVWKVVSVAGVVGCARAVTKLQQE